MTSKTQLCQDSLFQGTHPSFIEPTTGTHAPGFTPSKTMLNLSQNSMSKELNGPIESTDRNPFPWRDIIDEKRKEKLEEKRLREIERQRRVSMANLIVKKNNDALDKLEKMI